jgi:acyl carrier protein
MPAPALHVEAYHLALRSVMPEETVEQAFERIVLKVTKKTGMTVSSNTTFADLKADSLDRVQILIALEDTYDIALPEEEVAKINTMGEFVGLVEKKMAEKKKKA